VSSFCASRSSDVSYMASGSGIACGGMFSAGLAVYSAGDDSNVNWVRLSSPADKESLHSKLLFGGGSAADLKA
jgi:hypothetical protein